MRPLPQHFAVTRLQTDELGWVGSRYGAVARHNGGRNGPSQRRGFPQYVLFGCPGPGRPCGWIAAGTIASPADRRLVGGRGGDRQSEHAQTNPLPQNLGVHAEHLRLKGKLRTHNVRTMTGTSNSTFCASLSLRGELFSLIVLVLVLVVVLDHSKECVEFSRIPHFRIPHATRSRALASRALLWTTDKPCDRLAASRGPKTRPGSSRLSFPSDLRRLSWLLLSAGASP